MDVSPPTQATLETLNAAGIAAVFLFGSQTEGVAGPLSDTDLGVLLTNPPAPNRTLRTSAELDGLLADLFPELPRIEVTLLNTAPVELQLAVLKRGQPLAVLDEEALATFREHVSLRAGDLLPFLRAYRRDLLRHNSPRTLTKGSNGSR